MVHSKGNFMEALVALKSGVNTPVKFNKWLVIYLPQNKRIHLKSANKMYFGTGFLDLHGSYSGTADLGPDRSIPNTRGFHSPTSEMEYDAKKADSGASKKPEKTKLKNKTSAVYN